jgi:hypothetical protein
MAPAKRLPALTPSIATAGALGRRDDRLDHQRAQPLHIAAASRDRVLLCWELDPELSRRLRSGPEFWTPCRSCSPLPCVVSQQYYLELHAKADVLFCYT